MSTLKTNNIQHVDRSDPSIIINTDGSVNIAGTMTYEDVTNVDAVGIITGRDNVDAQKRVLVGTGVSVKAGGINVTAGITTVQALQATTGTFSGDITANGNITGDDSTNITGINQVTIGDLYISENIVHRGDDNTRIRFPAADTIAAQTGGIERLRITSTGDVNIGGELTQTDSRVHIQDVTRPLQEGTLTLSSAATTDGAADNGATLRFFGHDGSTNRYQSSIRGAKENGSSGNYAGYLAFNTRPNGGSMVERLRIDSGGRVIINDTSNANAHTQSDDLIVGNTSHGHDTGITIVSNPSYSGWLAFSDGTSASDQRKAGLVYQHSSDALFLRNNGNQNRLTINASGDSTFAGIVTATEFVPTVSQLSHRNIIINGDCRIAQRGTSSTSSGYQTVDRFKQGFNNLNESPTQQQTTVAAPSSPYNLPTSGAHPYKEGFRKAYYVQNGNQTTAAGANQDMSTSYFIEGQDLVGSGWDYTDPNSYLTISFWVKTSVAQTYYVGFRLYGPSNANQREYCFNFTPAAFTWTKVTHSIPGHASNTLRDDNNMGAFIQFIQYWGTNYTSSGRVNEAWQAKNNSSNYPDVAGNWYNTNDASYQITGLQLEVGSQATPFEHRSFGEELLLCQRYYQQLVVSDGNSGIGILRASSSNNFQQLAGIPQIVKMRTGATGAVVSSNSTITCRRLNGSSSDITATISYMGGSSDHARVSFRFTGSGFVNTEPYACWDEQHGGIVVSQDAEL